MKKTLFLAGMVLAALLAVSCGKPKQVLHIYNWGDYISNDVLPIGITTFCSRKALKSCAYGVCLYG